MVCYLSPEVSTSSHVFLVSFFWQPLKRAKSDGSEVKDVTAGEARARMDRAFTMPQFVTSVAGYGGSARAKQVSTSTVAAAAAVPAAIRRRLF